MREEQNGNGSAAEDPNGDGDTVNGSGKTHGANGDTNGTDQPMSTDSPFDPLFDEADADADGETEGDAGGANGGPSANITVPGSPSSLLPTTMSMPGASPPRPAALDLSLPGSRLPNGQASGDASAPLFNVPPALGSATSRTGAADQIPLLSPSSYRAFSDDILLASTMDGQVTLMDRRVPSTGSTVGRLMPGDKAPPWCMSACWAAGGTQILAGRRNGTVDIWDVRRYASLSTSGSASGSGSGPSRSRPTPNLLRTLRTPTESGPVSCIVPFPDGRSVATASYDNIRLWNTADYFDQEPEDMALGRRGRGKPPFRIVAGHHGGIVSQMMVDPTCRFLVCASGDRGWAGESSKVVLIHEIKW